MKKHLQGLYSVEDAMKYLGGIGRRTLYEHINAHTLESLTIGSRRFFTKEQLDSFIQNQLAAQQ